MPASLVERIMAERAARGLRLSFRIPGRSEPYVCFAKDDAQKARWMAAAERKGWTICEPAPC